MQPSSALNLPTPQHSLFTSVNPASNNVQGCRYARKREGHIPYLVQAWRTGNQFSCKVVAIFVVKTQVLFRVMPFFVVILLPGSNGVRTTDGKKKWKRIAYMLVISKPEEMNLKLIGDFRDNRHSKMHVQHHCQIDKSS